MSNKCRGYVDLLFLALAAFVGILLAGGFSFINLAPQNPPTTIVIAVSPTPFSMHKSLQLDSFGFTTPTPAPSPTIPTASCKSNFNQEPENYTASVYVSGQLKIWACDEHTPFLAPGAQVNNTTGQITNPGNTTAKDSSGNIYAPRIYLDNDNIVSNIHPIYPNFVKGNYTSPDGSAKGNTTIDPIPPNHPGPIPCDSPSISDEYIWNISTLGLTLGTHQVQFVFHDGDEDQGLGCFSISI